MIRQEQHLIEGGCRPDNPLFACSHNTSRMRSVPYGGSLSSPSPPPPAGGGGTAATSGSFSLSGLPPAASLASLPTFTPGIPSTVQLTESGCPPLPSLLSMATASSPLLIPKAKPLAYSPVLHPIPARAVEKIRSGAYLDFKDLLVDNIPLSERLQELGHPMVLHNPSLGSVKLRNISDPLTWVFCFLSFMAASSDCINTRNMAAYAQIVILQSRKHPGCGWLAYDQLFRQQRAAGVDLPWNDLAPSIMASTVL